MGSHTNRHVGLCTAYELKRSWRVTANTEVTQIWGNFGVKEELTIIQDLSQCACEVACLPEHDLLTGHVKNGIYRGLPFH